MSFVKFRESGTSDISGTSCRAIFKIVSSLNLITPDIFCFNVRELYLPGCREICARQVFPQRKQGFELYQAQFFKRPLYNSRKRFHTQWGDQGLHRILWRCCIHGSLCRAVDGDVLGRWWAWSASYWRTCIFREDRRQVARRRNSVLIYFLRVILP